MSDARDSVWVTAGDTPPLRRSRSRLPSAGSDTGSSATHRSRAVTVISPSCVRVWGLWFRGWSGDRSNATRSRAVTCPCVGVQGSWFRGWSGARSSVSRVLRETGYSAIQLSSFQAKRALINKKIYGLSPERPGQNLAWIVLHVPSSLDGGALIASCPSFGLRPVPLSSEPGT